MPLGRIHRFVVEYYRLCRPPLPGETSERLSTAPVMMDFAQQLLTSHPAEAALAFAPLVSLFGEVLDEAESAGCIRAGLRHSPVAGMALEVIMFNAFSTTISRDVDPGVRLGSGRGALGVHPPRGGDRRPGLAAAAAGGA